MGECRKVIAVLIADNHSSDEQIARVNILRYLDLLLSRATGWIDDAADLLAIVLRSEIELRGWAEFVSESPEQATKFLNKEVVINADELDKKMRKAFPVAAFAALPNIPNAKRTEHPPIGETVDYDFKLCSKLIHPSALMLNRPEATIRNENTTAYLAVEVLLYAWVGVVALLARRCAKGFEAFVRVGERIKTGAPPLVGERRICNHVVKGLERAAVLELGIGERIALDDERGRIVVQDHVHPGETAGGGVFLLPVERDFAGGFVGDFEQQGAGAAGGIVDGGIGTGFRFADFQDLAGRLGAALCAAPYPTHDRYVRRSH